MQRRTELAYLRNGGTSVVLDARHAALPVIVAWGPDLGDLGPDDLAALGLGARPQRVSGGLDQPARLTVIPQESGGWLGTPGLAGHRAGRDFSTKLVTESIEVDGPSAVITATDAAARLAATIELHVTDAGLLRQRITLENRSAEPYELVALAPTFPLPRDVDELLDTTGRHLRERSPQRHAFTIGSHVRDSRRGRPGADASLLLAAGRAGFGFERGLVYAVHTAWSGNHRLLAERTPTADAFLSAGELLAPGEIRLAEGESYTTPWAIGSWGDGLNELSKRFHDELRARPQHPQRPRPVTLNTWEAVYFDHDLDTLTALAERAARVGVERFVLDDGWFRGRRDDTSGLGDWFVDADVWPEGLGPIIERVRGLGMEFGLWVEPEMVNLDSDLAREHPDWILRGRDELPVEARQQHVLDLAHPDARQYLLDRLDALLAEYDIAYLKWDHNRDLLEAGAADTGRPRVHENVAALYRLLAALKRRHPGLEIESCASGGARVDLGILEHTDRIWTSDTLDPIERLQIQRYTGLLVPTEIMGAHLTSPEVHSTGRSVSLDLSAGIALFGHFGIEWNLTDLDDAGLDAVASWVARHKAHRALIHSGALVHGDTPDATTDVRGVVARDAASALFTFTQVSTSVTYPPGRFTLPGLAPDRRYTVRIVAGSVADGPGQSSLPWVEQPITLTGRQLGTVGLQAPVLFPAQLVLLELTAPPTE
ncbi:alpha-galactosidase [Agromyces aurantiacus]|uniref:alpha-galactosidase n=1 Tax=Agromyces aurantiacus TaxID=165814 RepID=A0ABV9R574_9MICO|nr:alpha-galactosidase [Agromyces aurantiacus]MBM7503292.1 alpha-galactosidase [Agromyces aurantiacus]